MVPQPVIAYVWVIPNYGLRSNKIKLPMVRKLSLEAARLFETEWDKVKGLPKNPWML
jgi:hypothetical protein